MPAHNTSTTTAARPLVRPKPTLPATNVQLQTYQGRVQSFECVAQGIPSQRPDMKQYLHDWEVRWTSALEPETRDSRACIQLLGIDVIKNVKWKRPFTNVGEAKPSTILLRWRTKSVVQWNVGGWGPGTNLCTTARFASVNVVEKLGASLWAHGCKETHELTYSWKWKKRKYREYASSYWARYFELGWSGSWADACGIVWGS
ncbi:hypothetical protein Micbo1qcDRAFT_179322 [Microdochium bolleyi]|uniref:Uncharacterized protein n=1 Tax=Microdochium bolleyi TaxID=196109 RepID=A0A136IQ71_9PEZI|nr:hypothetical protein Micbo1qcDRAFT_179322 [Microdochium bolleyi]